MPRKRLERRKSVKKESEKKLIAKPKRKRREPLKSVLEWKRTAPKAASTPSTR